ncbi:MAG: DUF423 domain-containing protein [Opitutaceae bacterium]
MNHRLPVIAAGLLGATGTAAGALGAHALRPFLVQAGTLQIWQTGVHYHLAHAIALLGLGAWMRAGKSEPSRLVAWTAWCWIVGVALFSGSLYLFAAGAPPWIWPMTPLGGIAFIAGWLFLASAAWPRSERP